MTQQNDFQTQLTALIHKARMELGMVTAIASFIEDDNYTILAVDSIMEGVFAVGQVFPLQDTYCRAVFETKAPVNYYHVATVESMLQHPVYQAVKLESYIAAPVTNGNNDVIGTLNFTSLEPHRPAFSELEKEMVDALAKDVSVQYQQYQALAQTTSKQSQ